MKRSLHSNPQLEEFKEIRNTVKIVKRGEKDIQFSEFSAFGPWIYEISPEHPVPDPIKKR